MKAFACTLLLIASAFASSAFGQGLVFGQDGTTMNVYNEGRRIVTWYDYKDHDVAGNYFVISDTKGETWAYDFQGTVLTKWYDSVDRPWILEQDYFILIDTKGEAWAFNTAGTVLSKWYDFKDAYAFPNYYVMLDTGGETWVYRPDGSVITKWYDSLNGQYRWDFFALSDTKGETWVFDLSGAILTKWYDTRTYELGYDFYALLDTAGELGIYDLQGRLIQTVEGVSDLRRSWRGGVEYLKNGTWYQFTRGGGGGHFIPEL